MTSKNQPVENQDILSVIDDYLEKYPDVHFEWVKGHESDYGNSWADRLANWALDEYEIAMSSKKK